MTAFVVCGSPPGGKNFLRTLKEDQELWERGIITSTGDASPLPLYGTPLEIEAITLTGIMQMSSDASDKGGDGPLL